MKHLILAGGGHSHIEVLRRFAANPLLHTQLTVVSPSPQLVYTGMLPGVTAGLYHLDECLIDIAQLANRAGADWRNTAIAGIDPISKVIRLADNSQVPYDILSLNIGAIPPRTATPGADRFTVPIKPMNEFLAWWETLLVNEPSLPPLKIGIVGAGAGGVELALSIERRLRSLHANRPGAEVFLVTDGADIMPGHNRLVRRWLRRLLLDRGVALHTNARIVSVEAKLLRSADGRTFSFDHAIWTTGAAPEPWVSDSLLATDVHGFVAVNDYLQSTSHPEIFAAGDVATQMNAPRPKAGVYAVRQGSTLAENLRRIIDGKPLIRHQPQRRALALIGNGERYAVASRGLLAFKGEWVWRWKEKIDREFVAKYRAS